MKHCTLTLLLMACCTTLSMAGRTNLTLNDGWRFHKGSAAGAAEIDFDDTSWEEVTVPHCWNTDIIKNQVNADHYQGDGWYRSELPIDRTMKGKRLFLHFEGALAWTDVYLNGQRVGEHLGGYTAFCFEITDRVNWSGKNQLAVKVNNADTPKIIPDGSRLFPRFGGMYRPVHLLVTETACITPLDHASPGVFIRQHHVSAESADLAVTVKLSNASGRQEMLTVKTTVLDADGTPVVSEVWKGRAASGKTTPVELAMRIRNPHLWNGREDPYLYAVNVEVYKGGEKIDAVMQPLGLRFFEIDPEKGFFLNGRKYPMYGVTRHQDWEHEATALTDAHHAHDVGEMLEIGATTVRLAHYPQSRTMYHLCDTGGLIVWAEIPVVQGVKPGRKDTFENAKQQLVEMIRQNFNNPSIFFWGLYNECWINTPEVEILHNLAKAEDPGRLTTAATHQKELADRHRVTDLICWNKYPKWYGETDLEGWADTLHAEVPDLRFGISEYGAGGCIDQHEIPPRRPNPSKGRFFPEEYMNEVHEQVWPMLATREYLWGTYLWNMFDFGWPGVTRGSRININNKGLITYDRKTRKDAFYYYKANWSDEPVLYITSRRFVNRTEASTPVKVYSNCDHIVLTLNGKSYPAPDGAYGVYKWEGLQLDQGENEVVVRAQKNGRTVEDRCVWILSEQQDVETAPAEAGMDDSVFVSAADASSWQKSRGHAAEHAIDGDQETFWCASGSSMPQWLELNLLQSTEVGGVSILWGSDGAYAYEVQLSDDGKNWKTVEDAVSTGQNSHHEFRTSAYFVRVAVKNGPGWAAIREVKVLAQQHRERVPALKVQDH